MTPVDCEIEEIVAEPLPPEVELNGTFFARLEEIQPLHAKTLQTTKILSPGLESLEVILDAKGTLLPFHFLRTGDRLGRAVVKLLRVDGAAGTGFLVAPGILLTNHHVLPDVAAAGSAIALANYEAAPPGATLGRPASVPLCPDDLFVTNAELDFTFCGIQGLDFLGSIALGRDSLNIMPTETVNIIQHPRGRPKEVALRDNRVVKADGVILHYACSTEPGSSGSPVFNNQWETVAVHHASVVSEGPEGRLAADPGVDGSLRYLNEGIRTSAIALWLDTAEAETPEARDQVIRLRSIFGGIDNQVGFFGALGRKALGRTALEVVVESYRGETDDLDIAFWNLKGLEAAFRDQIGDIGRIVAEMGVDLWCLVHADAVCISALREHLETNFQLDFAFFHEPPGAYPGMALLYRRSKALVVERRGWGLDTLDGLDLPPLVTVRASTPRSGTVAFQLVPAARPIAPESPASPFAEAVRQAIKRGHGELDWIILGETPVLLAPEKLHVLADCDRELIAAAADRDGALALLTGPGSKVARVFVSPNLRPAFGVPELLAMTRDRELPTLLKTLGGYRPIALRLVLEPGPRPASRPTPVPAIPEPAMIQPPRSVTDDDLERRIRDMLTPILAKILADPRPHAGGT